MNRVLLKLAMTVALASLLFSTPTIAQILPPAKKAAHVRIDQGPELESANDNWTIITWRSNNPGGSDDHYGVVHYGTNPKQLSQTAKSHIRLNQSHSYTIFHVRVLGLKPRTTYYYVVDSMEANGTSHIPAFRGGDLIHTDFNRHRRPETLDQSPICGGDVRLSLSRRPDSTAGAQIGPSGQVRRTSQ
jgi:Purple acid Phosphatase, N-terminal domain